MSWYQPHLQLSLNWIMDAARDRSSAIIDVGGGASTLVEDLLARHFRNLTVLDLSDEAIRICKERLGTRAGEIIWLVGNVTTTALPAQSYEIWHDRAVFHFLTDKENRMAYVRQLTAALRPGGHVITASFGPRGPMRCSGLETVRYDAEALQKELGTRFQLVKSLEVDHQTPVGTVQQFLYCHFTMD